MRCLSRRTQLTSFDFVSFAAIFHFIASYLRCIAWLVGIVYANIPTYWFLIHPFAERMQRWRRSPFHLVLPLWFLVILLGDAATWPWHWRTLYAANAVTWIAAAVLFLCGLFIYRQIGRFGVARFAGFPELRPREHEQKLVTTGLHARVRHPIYLAHLCMFLAWTISSGLLVLYALLPAALVLAAIMIHLEERELQRRFGEAYREYAKRTPAILPLRFR